MPPRPHRLPRLRRTLLSPADALFGMSVWLHDCRTRKGQLRSGSDGGGGEGILDETRSVIHVGDARAILEVA